MTPTEQLVELTKRWNDFEDVPKSQQLECTALGRKIYAEGGEDAMRDAYYVAKGQNRSASVVAAYWHGIGNWMW